jgi:hypothetical protein
MSVIFRAGVSLGRWLSPEKERTLLCSSFLDRKRGKGIEVRDFLLDRVLEKGREFVKFSSSH